MRFDKGVAPFLVPSTETVMAGDWMLQDEEGLRKLPEHLPYWDYQTDLDVERMVRVRADEVREQAALPVSAVLRMVVEWYASASQSAGLACAETVVDGRRMTLKARLHGVDLGGRLRLSTRLVLASDTETAEPFVVSRAGEVLYEDRYEVHLQGDSGRLPVSVIDFAANDLDPNARWWLDVHSDPTVPYSGAVRLYLNKADAELIQTAQRAANPSHTQKRLLEWLHADVARQLVECALRREWIDVQQEFSDDPDSLGSAVASLTSLLFEEHSLEELATLKETDPGRFAARLQGALRRTPRMDS